jgi:hypothetical protein
MTAIMLLCSLAFPKASSLAVNKRFATKQPAFGQIREKRIQRDALDDE